VVPVFNGERYIRESLDSILSQTYPNIELLVLDDGSTDATPQIVASYGDAVRYHRQPATRGIYGNANDGIAQASGDFVCVYHADDVYLPTIVEREAAFLTARPDVGARSAVAAKLVRTRRPSAGGVEDEQEILALPAREDRRAVVGELRIATGEPAARLP